MEYGDDRVAQTEMRLWNAFDAVSLEDGVIHPAEQIIGDALRDSDKALDWLGGFAADAASPVFAASVLRCLARHNEMGTIDWRKNLVQEVLTSSDVQMRDAALQAAEEWGGPELRAVLELHLPVEPVLWLHNAMEEVIEDLRD